MTLSDPLRITRNLVVELEKLNVPYLVGGSLASSLHGIPRATQDVDVVIDISEEKLRPLCDALKEHFFVDEQMAFKCKQKNQAFNIIDKDDLFKIDIFFLGNDKFSQCEMKRKITYTLSDDPSESIVVCSPEDIIIHKLYWYQLGDGVSDRQWNDVMNVIKIQKQNLDFEYLKSAAENKGVSDLLEKALKKRR